MGGNCGHALVQFGWGAYCVLEMSNVARRAMFATGLESFGGVGLMWDLVVEPGARVHEELDPRGAARER